MTSVLTSVASLSRDAFFVNVTDVSATDFFNVDGTQDSSSVPNVSGVTAAGAVLLRDMGKTVRSPAQAVDSSVTNQVMLRKVVVVSSVANSAVGEGDATATQPFYINLLSGKWARV
jgi:hypothetical protein